MIAMMDVDRSGKLGLEEFKILWTDVRNWRVSFFSICVVLQQQIRFHLLKYTQFLFGTYRKISMISVCLQTV
jgi:hypothetical protein